jgi:ribosome biogenesis GTPase
MNEITEKLESLGYSAWFRANTDADRLPGHQLARVVSVHKDNYMVTNGTDEALAELTGRLSYSATSAADLPTIGDWVYVDFYDANRHAIIHAVVSRKTLIQRKTSGKAIDFQPIAANVDVAFIVQSLDYNFNLRRLERYLVMINESNVTAIILLSKCDLKTEEELGNIVESVVKIAADTRVIAFSNESGANLGTIKNLLLEGHTYCLLGSSGVGKTTLVNGFLGDLRFETKAVSKKDSKGRHTTTSRELVHLPGGALLIDTPGMRELGNLSVDGGIDQTFAEIVELAMGCKFSNCKHIKEKGCAILAAIEDGLLTEQRYQNYIKMKNESAFNEMSYFEKRQKDKNFGKLIKSTINNKCR